MARNIKNSNKIVVHEIEYRWRATGNDGWITVTVWPKNNVGPLIRCNFGYHETMEPNGPSVLSSMGDQLIITNRIVRRIILHAISKENYNPNENGPQLNLRHIEDKIVWEDAVRANGRQV